MGGKADRGPAAAIAARLAAAQHGVVSRAQLLDAGLSSREVDRGAESRWLVRLHPGVYAVGHRRLTPHGFSLAAVLAAGPGAVLSHRSAAALHGLGRWGGSASDVTSPRHPRSAPGVRVRARRPLHPDDVTTVEGIPATSVARTLVDLAEVVSHDRVLHALTEAERAASFDARAVEAALARTRGRPGPSHARFRAALAEHARRGVQLTRSELELGLRALVRDHGVPEAEHNARVEGEEVDACWRAAGLVVEADGWATHRDRSAFARDRAKSRRLTLLGWRVLRFTHAEIVHDPAAVAQQLATALGQSAT